MTGSDVKNGVVTTAETNGIPDPAERVERRSRDRRGNPDRRKHDSEPPDGVERRSGERRKSERRKPKNQPD